jgi:hypothetical protein
MRPPLLQSHKPSIELSDQLGRLSSRTSTRAQTGNVPIASAKKDRNVEKAPGADPSCESDSERGSYYLFPSLSLSIILTLSRCAETSGRDLAIVNAVRGRLCRVSLVHPPLPVHSPIPKSRLVFFLTITLMFFW